MKVEQLKTVDQVKAVLLEAALLKGFPNFKGSRRHAEDLLDERLIFSIRNSNMLQAVALVNEESFHEQGYMGIGLIDFADTGSNQEVAVKMINRLFIEAKSRGKGLRNAALDPQERWLKPIFESVAQQYPTVMFLQA